MEIFKIESQITKWSKTEGEIRGKIKEGPEFKFKLLPHHPIHKSVFTIYNNIHITTEDTDFILDIDVETTIHFDIKTSIPTVKDLYAAYLAAMAKEEDIFVEHKELGDTFAYLNTHGRNFFFREPFESISQDLREVITINYPYS